MDTKNILVKDMSVEFAARLEIDGSSPVNHAFRLIGVFTHAVRRSFEDINFL